MNTVKADPKRPYKAYVALALSFLGLMWANLQGRPTLDSMDLMDWLTVVIPAVLTAGGTYLIENPRVVKVDEGGVTTVELCLIVVAVSAVVYVLFGANLIG